MTDTLFADVSEFQVPVDNSYPYQVLSIRVCDGTYVDHNFAQNYAWMRAALDSGQLAFGIVYTYVRPQTWQSNADTVRATIDANGGLHPRVALMLDVESGGNPGGDQSGAINNLYTNLADYAGSAARIIGYGNVSDLDNMWPNKPSSLRIIVASYGSDPGYPGKVAHQYTDGTGFGAASGIPDGCPPFGNCDMNSADGLDPVAFAAACGIGVPPTPPAPPPPPPSHHIVLTVAGTGSDMWNATSPQPAFVGSTLAANMPGTYFWQPVGDYPAATFPMGPSVTAGVQSLIYLTTGETYPGFNITPGRTYGENSLILLGYSQGAMVVCQFIQWCYQFNRMDILQRIVCVGVWGNPQRLEGFASGNEFASWPLPANKDGSPTGGIAQGVNPNGPANMTLAQMQPRLKTPVTHYWGDFVNTNDPDQGNTELYANCPQNGVGTVEQSIFNAVQNLNGATALGVLQDLALPMDMGLAILNGFEFLAALGNADHYTYDTTPIYNFVALAGSQTAPWGPV